MSVSNPQSYEPLAGKFPQYNSVQIELIRRFLKGLEKTSTGSNDQHITIKEKK